MFKSTFFDIFTPLLLRGCLTTFLGCWTLFCQSQSISRYEYFIDGDPGVGNGMIATLDGSNTFTANLANVSDGIHNIYVRAKDAAGYWSLASSRTFIKQSGGSANSGTIIRCEYFFNTDPGVGNALPATIGPNNTFIADVTGIADGMYNIFVRVQDASGSWSLVSSRTFMKQTGGGTIGTIAKYEYFIDTDPGLGNGIAATVVADTAFIADLTNTSNGLHTLYIRVQDAAGSWSLTHAKPFMKFISNADNSSHYEYFIDTDTGVGTGQPFTTDANRSATIPLENISAGVHQLFVRVKDGSGNWSLTHQKTFVKFNGTGSNPITRMEYFWDTDPGLGNGTGITGFTSVVGQPVTHEFSPDVSNLSIGKHGLNVRVRDSLGSWSLLHSDSVNIQKKGVTVIVHGFSAPTSGFPTWTIEMANAIRTKAGGGNIFQNNPSNGQWVALGGNSNNLNDEIILLYDWADLSNNGLGSPSYAGNGYLESAADNLFAMLNVTSLQGMVGNVNLLNTDKPLHFIAHSRGNPLSLQLFHRLNKYFPNKKIDQLTLLDPHPGTAFGDVHNIEESNSPQSLPCVIGNASDCGAIWNPTAGCLNGSGITIRLPDNVITADCYYRKDGIYEGASDMGSFDGVPVVGLRFNRELSQYWMDLPISIGIPTFSVGGAHSRVHTWYYGTIKNTGLATYGDFNISDTEPVNWYNYAIFPQNINAPAQNIIDGRRTKTGFNYSRIGGLGYPSEPTTKLTLAGMEVTLAARTGGFGLRPIFNGDFQYGDSKAGWTLNGGIFTGTIQTAAENKKLKLMSDGADLTHSLFYFPLNSSPQYLRFLMTPTENNLITARRLRIWYKGQNESTSQAIYEGTISGLTINTSQYIYCSIPTFLNGKIGTFSLANLIGGDITVDDFDIWTGTPPTNSILPLSSTLLPVELMSFDVKRVQQNAHLTWQTASERNSDHFDIERSTNGKQFVKIGEVKAFGSTNQVQNYSYLDVLLPPQYEICVRLNFSNM
jgi:hypothetical protein